MELLQSLEDEVKRRADEATPELLPALLEKLSSSLRHGLIGCARHGKLLAPYIAAQIELTRAKRRSNNYCDNASYKHYYIALEARDQVRRNYRSTPCSCWVQHR